jgi:hypothetical protein
MSTVIVHRWAQDGIEWACAAYDHGPFCRRCQRVTDNEMFGLCLENVDRGLFEVVGTEPDGEFRFRVSPNGEQRIAELLSDNPSALALFLQTLEGQESRAPEEKQ